MQTSIHSFARRTVSTSSRDSVRFWCHLFRIRSPRETRIIWTWSKLYYSFVGTNGTQAPLVMHCVSDCSYFWCAAMTLSQPEVLLRIHQDTPVWTVSARCRARGASFPCHSCVGEPRSRHGECSKFCCLVACLRLAFLFRGPRVLNR